MHNLKKNKKTGIMLFHSRLISRRHNGYFEDIVLKYLRKYLVEELGRTETHFITEINKHDFSDKNISLYKRDKSLYKDIDIVDVNYYDEIIIFNTIMTQLYGRFVPSITVKNINLLNKFKGDIYYYLDDPSFVYRDIADILLKRKKKLKFNQPIDDKSLKHYTKYVNPRVNVIWVGRDYDKYNQLKNNKLTHKKAACIPMSEYIFKSKNKVYKDYNFNREFDIVYYGKPRKDGRENILNHYFNNNMLKTYWIGYKPPFDVDLFNKEGFPIDILMEELCRGYCTIVTGSKFHNGNIISPRYLECMASDIISFIDYRYDDGVIVKDKTLRDYLIVKNIDELKSKLNEIKQSESLFREIISKSRNEINL